MGICDSCMREEANENENSMNSDSLNLKKIANENERGHSLLVKEDKGNEVKRSSRKHTIIANVEPEEVINHPPVNKKEDTKLELEESTAKNIIEATPPPDVIASGDVSEKHPPNKLEDSGPPPPVAPAYTVRNKLEQPDSGLVKLKGGGDRRGHAGHRYYRSKNDGCGCYNNPPTAIGYQKSRSTGTYMYQAGKLAKYTIGTTLGVGSTSTCYYCKEEATGQEYACKLLNKKFLQENYSGLLHQFMLEIDILKILKHPNIIFLKDIYNTPSSIYMVMELVKGGEMFDYIVQRGRLSEGEASSLIRQVASGLTYMHAMGVVHRDLKPENLLLTVKDIRAEVKIIDFGLAKILSPENGYKTSRFLGTKGYLAPEMLRRCEYGFKVDTWALGIIMFILLFGCLPFDDDLSPINEAKVMSRFVLRFPHMSKKLSKDAKFLLKGLLCVSPTTRLSAADTLNHSWLGANVKGKNTMLESPKRLKQMEKIGTPGQSYGQTRNAIATQRKADFENEKQEMAPFANVSGSDDNEWSLSIAEK